MSKLAKKANHRDRSIKYYEKQGCIVAHVESKNLRVLGPAKGHPPGVMLVRFFGTRDLLGFADLVVWYPEGQCVLVQYTSGDNHATRVKKIWDNETAVQLIEWGVVVHVLSWRMPAGKGRYAPRLEVLSFEEEG